MTLIHPRMLANLWNFYPSTAVIEEATMTQDSVGEPIPAWADFLTDLDCRLSPTGGSEPPMPNQTYSIGSHTVSLASYQPTIEVEMRALVGGIYYDILVVEHDGNAVQTRLQVQVVE